MAPPPARLPWQSPLPHRRTPDRSPNPAARPCASGAARPPCAAAATAAESPCLGREQGSNVVGRWGVPLLSSTRALHQLPGASPHLSLLMRSTYGSCMPRRPEARPVQTSSHAKWSAQHAAWLGAMATETQAVHAGTAVVTVACAAGAPRTSHEYSLIALMPDTTSVHSFTRASVKPTRRLHPRGDKTAERAAVQSAPHKPRDRATCRGTAARAGGGRYLRTLASALPTEPAMGISISVAPRPAIAGPQWITRTSRPITTRIWNEGAAEGAGTRRM